MVVSTVAARLHSPAINNEGRVQLFSSVYRQYLTDPEFEAAMQVLSCLTPPAYFTDSRLGCLQICCMVKIGMQHGTSGAFSLACGYFGNILGPVFHRYTDGYRFAKLASDLIEKHDFFACKAKIYHLMGHVTIWTQPIANARFRPMIAPTFAPAIISAAITRCTP